MKPIFDITVPLGPATPLYPGDPAPEVRLSTSIANGDGLTASHLAVGCHVGTHVDLPAHFLAGGRTLSDYPVAAFMGRAVVLELSDVPDRLSADRLSSETIPQDRHVLLKTRSSTFLNEPRFRQDYVFMEPDATRRILERGPRSIGIDYYSLDPPDTRSFPSHRLCAERGIPVFVCLDLRDVAPGDYLFAGLPLRMDPIEGCPIRAVLWR